MPVASFAERPWPRTGRSIVSFAPEDWGAVRDQLTRVAGFAAGRVRLDAEVAASPGLAAQTDVHAFPEIGWAVVSDAADEHSRQALRDLPGVFVRPEYVMQRPETVAVDAPPLVMDAGAVAPPLAPPLWLDDATLAWAVRAVGVRSTDVDGAGILVGVIDTGVDATHPHLQACLAKTVSLVPGRPADQDLLSHGTHVVGVVAGVASPGGGARYGIAPGARVNVYRVYGDDLRTDERTVAAAIQMAADDGCRVVSLASGRDGGDAFDPADAKLGEYVAARGCLLFAAAGNESDRAAGRVRPTNAPANAPRIYAVGAATQRDEVWLRSNGRATDAARRVDWLAPGTAVLSALPGGTTWRASGTSAATAVATGVAAAVWSRHPAWRADDVVAELRRLAAPVAGVPAAVGSGRLRVSDSP